MRIFIGFSEIANFVQSYKKGFEANGYKTYTVITNRNIYYPLAKYDVVISDFVINSNNVFFRLLNSIVVRVVTFICFIKALFSCDVFYYNTGGNMLPFALDYKLIKLFNKKLVIIFLGSEIRHWYAYEQELKELGYAELFKTCIDTYREQNYGSFEEKKYRVEIAEKYSSLILSQPGFAQLQTKPYMRANVGLNLDDYKYKLNLRATPIIVHAPSSKGIKGTEFIIKALDILKSEGVNFEFKLIENLPNHKLIQLLEEADIVIDELNSDTIGVLSTEAMATGNVVLTSYFAEFVKVPQPCPVLNTNKSNVYQNIKKAILNLDFRNDVSKEGRIYVEQHHDISKIINREIGMLYNTTPKEFDFNPTFYRRMSVPSNI